jgi:hypothetical protein
MIGEPNRTYSVKESLVKLEEGSVKRNYLLLTHVTSALIAGIISFLSGVFLSKIAEADTPSTLFGCIVIGVASSLALLPRLDKLIRRSK